MAQTCADENVAFIEKRAGRMEICMKKILHLIFGRFFVVAMAIILQVLWLCVVLWQLSYKFTYVNLLVRVIAIIVVLVIVNKWTNPANKLSWTFLILLSPIFGLMVYFLFGRSGLTKHTRERMDAVNRQVEALFQRDSAEEKGLEKESRSAYLQSSYIDKWAGFPLYQNTQTKYYSCGEEMFPDMLEALRGAKHFIFLEYFIIEEGYMFNTILDILEEKAKAGVDVRFIYDDVGSINSISFGYYKKLQERGIPCVTFNPFKPLISVVMNNRDHRKIFVVDGYIGFTGGINLADEYINKVKRFGYWKDTGVRIEGEAVWSLTAMFLEMWNYINRSTEDYSRFLPSVYREKEFTSDGFVQPYGDSPLDNENVGENIYLNIINRAAHGGRRGCTRGGTVQLGELRTGLPVRDERYSGGAVSHRCAGDAPDGRRLRQPSGKTLHQFPHSGTEMEKALVFHSFHRVFHRIYGRIPGFCGKPGFFCLNGFRGAHTLVKSPCRCKKFVQM